MHSLGTPSDRWTYLPASLHCVWNEAGYGKGPRYGPGRWWPPSSCGCWSSLASIPLLSHHQFATPIPTEGCHPTPCNLKHTPTGLDVSLFSFHSALHINWSIFNEVLNVLACVWTWVPDEVSEPKATGRRGMFYCRGHKHSGSGSIWSHSRHCHEPAWGTQTRYTKTNLDNSSVC